MFPKNHETDFTFGRAKRNLSLTLGKASSPLSGYFRVPPSEPTRFGISANPRSPLENEKSPSDSATETSRDVTLLSPRNGVKPTNIPLARLLQV
jgi:hypothetical protein